MAKKILIVDDEPPVRNATALMIKQGGYQVDQAASGVDALRKFIADHYDVIVMDNDMPSMNGYQCAKKIREYEEGTSKRSVIIGIASSGDEDMLTKCLNAGMDACLDKTQGLQNLQMKIRQWA